jgi:hypothetical protein
MKKYGDVDMAMVERALNVHAKTPVDLSKYLQQCLFYGDYKWIYCINFPSRHWMAVREKTISLVPKRTTDQYYFPRTEEGEHYITFSDTFEDIPEALDITKEQYEYITENCFQQYKGWVQSEKYRLNKNMMKRMFDSIEAGHCIDETLE